MLKTRPTGEGGTTKRLKIRLFQGANVDEMDGTFHGTIPAPWPIISTGFHSLGHTDQTQDTADFVSGPWRNQKNE